MRGTTEKAIFAAGCFWHVEEAFGKVRGVLKTTAGYTGGTTRNPTYQDVCTGRTGHAESVLMEYDPDVVSYDDLLEVFWSIHDPTTRDRQGPDVGTQYRSAIFFLTQEQKDKALASMERLERSDRFGKKRIATDIVHANEFYPAEEYHQRYFEKNRRKGCRVCGGR